MADLLLFSVTAAGYLYLTALSSKDEKISRLDVAPQAPNDDEEKELSVAQVSDSVILANAFPSLSQSLSRAPILGLYFAASWCGDCDAVTPALAKVIASQKKDEELVHIVYVSSDTCAEEMAAYKPEQFSAVPWEAEQERSSIKRFFGTCTGKERELLGISQTDRKHGTPTLFLLDAQSGSVLTESGVEQVERMESAESVLGEWKSMLFAVQGNSSWESLATIYFEAGRQQSEPWCSPW
jgi:thiol-disulfide isomerase/thioredoxin